MPSQNIGIKATAEKCKAPTESVGNANQVDDIIKRARAVVARMEHNLSWDVDWHILILALGHGRSTAMRAAATNKPKGHKYQTKIREFLHRHGFDCIDKSDRCRLFECHTHLNEINDWRSALPAEEQQTLNHPRVVLARWKQSLRSKSDDNDDDNDDETAFAVDDAVNWLTTAELSTTDRARVIAALHVVRSDVPPALAAAIVQHEVEKAHREAEEAKATAVALARCLKQVRSALATGASETNRIANARAIIRHHTETTNAKHRFYPESRLVIAAPAPPSDEALLLKLGRGKNAITVIPGTAPDHTDGLEENSEDNQTRH